MVYLYLKMYFIDLKWRERDLSSTGSLNKQSHGRSYQGWARQKQGARIFLCISHVRASDPNIWVIFCIDLDQKWCTWDSIWLPDGILVLLAIYWMLNAAPGSQAQTRCSVNTSVGKCGWLFIVLQNIRKGNRFCEGPNL